MKNNIGAELLDKKRRGVKSLAILLDPDKVDFDTLPAFIHKAVSCGTDYFFIGGSLITRYSLDQLVKVIRSNCELPVILFPGNSLHIEPSADAILFLSLISGRNADLLIGQHVTAAPLLQKSGLEIISTGYMLVESGKATTVSYISNTMPIPSDKPEIAACTALAGEMLGLKMIFLDAGSGAYNPVPAAMIRAVSQTVQTPLIVGGGIDTVEKVATAFHAGADVIVIGNAIERDPTFLDQLAQFEKGENVLQ